MTLPCIVCNVELHHVFEASGYEEGDGNQPSEGTTFRAHGQYGSTAFDPCDGSFIEVNICDHCLHVAVASSKDLVLSYKRKQRSTEDHYSPTVWDGN